MSALAGTVTLVTGADGFIGSHLVDRLLVEGASVRALCLYTSDGSLGWLDGMSPAQRAAVDVVRGDVRDARLVREVVAGSDLVFHLAALVAIPYSYTAPASFLDVNAGGTLNVLEAVREHATRLVHTSTSEVYGTPRSVPITEDHPLQAQSPYAASKIAADKLCEAYARSFGTRAVTLRPFNTYGPRQSARAVIPTVLGQMLAGAEELHLGNLRPERDFTYVEDTVDGFVRLAAADLAPGSVVHLGTGRAVSVGDLVGLCAAVTGSSARVVTDPQRVRRDGSEVEVLRSEPARARALLGWSPSVGLEEGLARTAAWLRGRVEPAEAARYHR